MLFDRYLRSSIVVLEESLSAIPQDELDRAIRLCVEAISRDKALLVCGNGGSASDAMHITGELVGRFLKERRALNAICLSSNPSVLTAWSNDYSYDDVFARQVEAHGRHGGVLIGISTSGNSRNVVQAARKAREIGMSVISLTGEGGGALAPVSDVLLAAPSRETPMIQQVHICLYHYLCARVEEAIRT